MWEVFLYLIFSFFNWWGEVFWRGFLLGVGGACCVMEMLRGVSGWRTFGVWVVEGGITSSVTRMMEMGSRLTDYQKLYLFPYDTER